MRGNKVLQYVQTFTEVRGNRILDDRAVRLGHQATHTGQLANLGCGTPRTRVGHDEDRIKRILHYFVALGVDYGLLADFLHHRARNLVVGVRPDVYNLVIALTRGNQSSGPLLFDILDFGFRVFDQFDLGFRNNHVIHTN